MRLIRVHVDATLAPGARITLPSAATLHLRRVLRLGPGDAVTLFNGDGSDYPSRIEDFGRGTAEAEVIERATARAESPLAITLVQGIAIAACEQCGRARVPAIAEPRTLDAFLAEPPPDGVRLLLTPEAQVSLAAVAQGAAPIALLVGPEGGLEEAERHAAMAAGWRACRLGPRVLRSETAAIAAIAVLQSVAGDLG